MAGDMRRLFRTAQHIDPHIGNPCVLTFMAVACPGRHIAPAILENYSSPAAARPFPSFGLQAAFGSPALLAAAQPQCIQINSSIEYDLSDLEESSCFQLQAAHLYSQQDKPMLHEAPL